MRGAHTYCSKREGKARVIPWFNSEYNVTCVQGMSNTFGNAGMPLMCSRVPQVHVAFRYECMLVKIDACDVLSLCWIFDFI